MPLNLLCILCVNNYKTLSLKYVIDQISNSLFVLCRNIRAYSNLLSCTRNHCYNENTNFGKYHRRIGLLIIVKVGTVVLNINIQNFAI